MTKRLLSVFAIGLACLVATIAPARATTLPHNPVGHIDSFLIDEFKYEAIFVYGWAGDFDAGSAPGQRVHLYVDGHPVASVATGLTRNDVYRRYPSLGRRTGFSIVAPVPGGRGSHTACVYAINRGPGATVRLGCKTFTITLPHKVIGHIDSFTVDPGNPARRIMHGWVLDPYDAVSPTPFGVKWVSGTPAPASEPSYVYGTTGLPRPDVDAAYPRNGHNHGFSITFDPGPSGLDWAAGSRVCLGVREPMWPGEGVAETTYCATYPG